MVAVAGAPEAGVPNGLENRDGVEPALTSAAAAVEPLAPIGAAGVDTVVFLAPKLNKLGVLAALVVGACDAVGFRKEGCDDEGVWPPSVKVGRLLGVDDVAGVVPPRLNAGLLGVACVP